MSFGKIGEYDALKSVQGATGTAPGVQGGARLAHLQSAFDNQMNMAQNLFGDGAEDYGDEPSAGSFDVSMINDSRMLEALATISRLMRNESGLQRGRANVDGQPMERVREASPPGKAYHVPGELSARFESGEAGAGAVGYDRVGGTSYGKYQIASKPGTMDRFLTYLDKESPEWADRLRSAGPADTGSVEGGMPAAWKAIAAENPAKFEKVQHDFIAQETYMPAREMILRQTGLDFDNAPSALREVLWSTSVQHGPTGAARIFNKVIDRFVGDGQDEDFNSMLIKGVYDTRKGQFGSSTERVQQSVANRMDTEKRLALNMLENRTLNRIV
ncbi:MULTISPECIES: hypothetical protein [unclassified Pseudodesulfovibrio]|uniref:VgrG-related protein n=1 Tax=unclassified Pseudodesulfovibrio TaxID=2661612 RepID=UPI000FEB68AB|nr:MULTISPECIES: hypothetical protein [unclassified Pseudodesulfovibrio]MCJ2164093.1 hypothetical protein [Pseudodesulfovibrio sp. S3-i]RWU05276.1 hypothetical protein DWB63_06365 [Pseudodesulfovibrio sp. S3]